MKKKIFLLSSILFLLDWMTKTIIKHYGTRIVVIPHFMALSYTENKGAAFSLLDKSRVLLIIVSLFVFVFLMYELMRKKLKKEEYYAYGLILAGLVGNLWDRLFYGYVIDYFEFQFFGYIFPIFNLADCFIVIGVFLLLLSIIRSDCL